MSTTGTCPICGRENHVLVELPDKMPELRVAEKLGGRRMDRACDYCWREQMENFEKEDVLSLLSQAMTEIDDREVEKKELDADLEEVKGRLETAEDEVKELEGKVDEMFDEAAVAAREDLAEKRGYNEGYNEGYDAGCEDGSEGNAERGAEVMELLG